MSKLGNFIRERREELGYKKMEFAKMMHIGDDTLRFWERGTYLPTLTNRTNLIALLNISEQEVKKYFPSTLT